MQRHTVITRADAPLVRRTLFARRQPLAVVGATACGKTTLVRTALGSEADEPRWTTARDLTDLVIEGMRAGRFEEWCQTFTTERRVLVVEHLEDLRGKSRTMQELQRLVGARVSKGSPVVLTLTLDERASDVLEWLDGCAEVLRLEPRAPKW